ncbi:MAG TPA: PilN domain-containing protein [Thiobacillaceae bacterium]|nr:PilN domain-containing protein [Nitrospira sp.]HNA81664.1 PilN domain-containing protein [Thiobacillaceae bacterium]HNF87883.1 PilN domain-containing protein [Thiobacillaceae bacterium]HNI06450.1 PilN domain-containing protein [Thiobacillaceae bacterium]
MTSIRINLLPHRQLRRARLQRLFAIFAAIAAGAGVAVVAAGQVYLTGAKSNQDKRNEFLRVEIAKLDKQIADIKQFKEKSQDLMDRKKAVEGLQSNRSESVHLFDELARRLPDGLYLKSVKQTGDQIALSGYAQSSARVSTLMRSLDDAEMFNEPTLVEVKSAIVGKLRVNEFSMSVRIAHPAEAEQGKPTAGAPGGKGGKS